MMVVAGDEFLDQLGDVCVPVRSDGDVHEHLRSVEVLRD
jgi:hypothetical protein